jgi:hypothetical protein
MLQIYEMLWASSTDLLELCQLSLQPLHKRKFHSRQIWIQQTEQVHFTQYSKLGIRKSKRRQNKKTVMFVALKKSFLAKSKPKMILSNGDISAKHKLSLVIKLGQ